MTNDIYTYKFSLDCQSTLDIAIECKIAMEWPKDP
jgi:hypothetical protein